MWNSRRTSSAVALLLAAACSGNPGSGVDKGSQAANGVPRPDHVLVVIMENTSYSTLIGSSSAPYINSLVAQGANFSNSHAVSHPSEPNYLALFSGSTQGQSSDACPLSFGTTNNLGAQAIAAGLTFTAYSEDLPSAGSTVCTSGNYARKHDPWVNFSNVPAQSQQPFTAWPSSNYASLPTIGFVVPNLCDDMHDCSVQTGDTWLKNNIDGYVQWAKTHNSLLILTWDEDDSSTSANQIVTLFVGPMVKQGTYAENITHYSVLHTIEDMYGLAAIGNAASAASITDIWSTTAANDFSVAVSPQSLSIVQGASGTATVSTAIVSGSAQSVTLSANGLPPGASVSFSPTSVTGAGSSTLTLTTLGATPAGTYTVSVIGSAASGTHSVNLSVTVTAPVSNDFSLAVSPQSLSVVQGASGSTNISTAVVSGNAQSIALSASGLPAGVTPTFNPGSVNAGSNATLTLAVSSSVAPGTYAVTVTGTAASGSHTASLSLTVTAPVVNDFTLSVSPTALTVALGASGTATASLAVSSGSAQSVALSVSGLPSTVTPTFSPTSVTGNGSSTLTLAVGSTTALGTYTVTVNGTGSSATHSATFSLSVVQPQVSDFSVAVSPASLTVTAGSSGAATVSTATTSGAAQSVALSTSTLPAGVTPTFSPTSVTSGASSTLTFAVAATVAAGTYPVTITGTGSSLSHTASLSLVVTAPVTGGLTNPGFELGSLSGWTSAGTTSVVSTGAHGGTYAAQVGATSPTNGDSSIAQTFTAPSGVTGLSFWYKVVCPDTLTYDWATATLKDTTSNTTTTVLAKVCSNTGTWTQVNAAVTAGHVYTLTLISHDDNYAGDPTYTLFDDVALVSTTPPPPSPLVNGDFETGSLSPWTTTGTTSVVSSGAHGGTYAAQLGSSNPTNGDSSVAQTFTAPAGSSKLSFWYKVTCPDTVSYDWATATLKDNTAGTSATVLAKTCTASGSWTQVTAAVTAGHSYTVTLTSHDDNYTGDPTYTLFDDVVVQ